MRRSCALLPCLIVALGSGCDLGGRNRVDAGGPPATAPVAAIPVAATAESHEAPPPAPLDPPAPATALLPETAPAPATALLPETAPAPTTARLVPTGGGPILELRAPPPLPADLSAPPPRRSLPPGLITAVQPVAAPPDPSRPPEATLNERILRLVDGYPAGPAHSYGWVRGQDTDGTSVDLIWQGVPLALADSDGSVHCSGITFEVYLRALADALEGGAAAPSAAQLQAIKERWYIRDGSEGGPVDALVEAGLGWRVPTFADLQPGDLVQFWRNSGKGHTAVFLRPRVTGDPNLQSMAYWSAQATSEGLGVRFKSVGDAVDQIATGRLYGVRAIVPAPSNTPTGSGDGGGQR